jgi:putative flippase GtrA
VYRSKLYSENIDLILDFSKFSKSETGKFLAVGAVSAAIYFSLMFIWVDILSLDYKLGVTLAYVVTVTLHFFANRHITFQASKHGVFRQGVRYIVTLAINYLITISVVYSCVEYLGLSVYVSLVLSIASTTISGYFLSKRWVFRTR